MRLIVGLGNPGQEYEDTRHNAGYWLLDRIARACEVVFRPANRFHGDMTPVRVGNDDVWLLKPTTFMNASGRAVDAVMRFYRIAPEQVLVVHDDLDLLPGQVRLKKGGGAGGHNGLKDTISVLGSADFLRLRIGIGHPGQRDDVVNYVLHRPSEDEQDAINEALVRSVAVLPQLLEGKTQAAMMNLHTSPKKAEVNPKG